MTFLRDLKFTLRSLAPVMNMKRIAQAPGISTWSLRIEAKPGSFRDGVVRIRTKRPKIAHYGGGSREGSLRNPFMGKSLD
jgi:hypothetical protein